MGYHQDGKQTDDQANQAHFESCSRIKVQRLFVRLHAGRGGGGRGGGRYILAKLTARFNHKLSIRIPPLKQLNFFQC